MSSLETELAALPAELLARLSERGFSAERLLALASTMGEGREARNRLSGAVSPPLPDDLGALPHEGTRDYERLRTIGHEALRRGEVGLCVLAGGMATRMGGVVKALVEALPGKTFLDLRLAEQASLRENMRAKVPLFLMASEATAEPIKKALGDRLDGQNLAVFQQCVSLRLSPEKRLFLTDEGQLSAYATGHGDLPEAFKRSGLLERFIQERGERAVIWIANLDNLGATIDPALLGYHLAHGGPLTVEVVDKVGTDRGGVPVRHEGRRIIAEEFRLPQSFDPTSVRVFNTNTFLVGAQALFDLDFDFTYVEVEKTVDERKAIQFERLLGEITVPLEPRFLRVSRNNERSRFLPVKDAEELAKRQREIQAVCKARGILA